MYCPRSTAELLHSVAQRCQTGWADPLARQPGGWPWLMLGVEEEAREEVSHFGGERTLPLATLEGVLFLAREPLSTRKLAQFAGLADGTEARTLVRKLNDLYDAEGCAFRVEEVAGGLQLMSRPKFAPWLRRLQAVPVEIRLSSPALETLAVVAYRQPVLRAEIEAIRGVQCGEILRLLMERDLVRIVGRSEELGRPFLYGTTRLFLQVFGLRHLDELPRPELLDGVSPGPSDREDAPLDITRSHKEAVNHLTGDFSQGEEATVKTRLQPVSTMLQEPQDIALFPAPGAEALASPDSLRAYKDDDDDEFEDEDEDEDDDEEEEDFGDDEEEDEEDEDLDDDDFEDEDWEEVEDDEDLDEDEDEDWDDEDEDWDDDEDDDWDDDEDEEGEEEGDNDE